MRKMRRSSVKVYRKLSDGPVLPQWVKFVPYVLGALVFFFVSTSMFDNDPTPLSDADRIKSQVDNFSAFLNDQASQTPIPNDETLLSPSPVVPTLPAPQVQEPIVPQPAPDASVKVSLPFRNGGSAEIENAALTVARAATVALFTGDFTQVRLAPGVQPPALPRTWSDPYVGDPVLEDIADGGVSVTFRVDPDRAGPSQLREITARVEFVPDMGWVWGGV